MLIMKIISIVKVYNGKKTMKKNGKKTIIIVIIMILIGVSFLSVYLFINDVYKNESEIEKDEYYNNMHKKMHSYYKVLFNYINIPEEKEQSNIKITLFYLQRAGFPIEEFISYDGKEKCDLNKSYALRKLVDNEYVINVYYKCGSDANYNYNTVTTKKIR